MCCKGLRSEVIGHPASNISCAPFNSKVAGLALKRRRLTRVQCDVVGAEAGAAAAAAEARGAGAQGSCQGGCSRAAPGHAHAPAQHPGPVCKALLGAVHQCQAQAHRVRLQRHGHSPLWWRWSKVCGAHTGKCPLRAHTCSLCRVPCDACYYPGLSCPGLCRPFAPSSSAKLAILLFLP
jgi:hypothetical protein